MVNCASLSSSNRIFLKIEQPEWIKDKEVFHYNFYDTIHQYSRLSIEIKETKNSIFLETLPF